MPERRRMSERITTNMAKDGLGNPIDGRTAKMTPNMDGFIGHLKNELGAGGETVKLRK